MGVASVVTSGRHRRDDEVPWYESRRRVRRTPTWLWPVAAVSGVAVLAAVALLAGSSLFPARIEGRSSCEGPEVTATVAASPDHADVLRRIAAEWSLGHPRVGGACAEVQVVTAASAAVAGAIGGDAASLPGGRPDAWAPESGVWPRLAASRPEAAAVLPRTSPRLATTPVVIAVPRERAPALGWPSRRFGWRQLLGGLRTDPTWGLYGRKDWGPFAVGMSDPTRSTAALHTLLALTDGNGNGAVEPAEVTNELLLERSVARHAPETEDLLALAQSRTPLSAFPATEQAVLAYNATSESRQLVPVYPVEGVAEADHPFLILSAPWVTSERRAVAQAFSDFATGPTGRAAYARANFRDRDRSAAGMPAARTDARVVAATYRTRPLLAAGPTAQVLVRWRALRRPANVLAAIDTSGSMADLAPGLPVTKLAVLQRAAAQSVRLFNVRSRLGVWQFSSKLSGNADYRPVVPVRPLGARVAPGVTQREAVIAGVSRLRPLGATGLYDTIDASYREVHRLWRKDQQNILVVMTDGKNEDPVGLSLPALVQSLRKTRNTAHPVTVILIAYGLDADVPALDRAAAATGGRTYVVRNPADIGKVFLAAMVNR
jgi:Ca-activated chloride channel family protein